MDIDSLLNIEKRTGVKDSDIDAFLEKVTNVQNTIQGMKDGSISPDEINFKDHGIKSDEEERKEKEEKRKRMEERKRKEAEAAALAKKEEIDRWWRHAEGWVGRKRDGSPLWDDDGNGVEVQTQDEILKRMEKKVEDAYSNDYSRWNQWEPKDPATLEEKAEQEALLDKVRDAEFEKNNAEWCKQFKDDMEDRAKKQAQKEANSEKAKSRGNQYFKRKAFDKAAALYMEALELTPFKVPVLTNLAQTHLRQSNMDDAAEFCERALFLDPKCIKAYSRRAEVKRRRGDLDGALQDLETAVPFAPDNVDLIKQRDDMVIEVQSNKDELAIQQAMSSAPSLPTPPVASIPGEPPSTPSDKEMEEALSSMEAALANPSLAGLSVLQRLVDTLRGMPQGDFEEIESVNKKISNLQQIGALLQASTDNKAQVLLRTSGGLDLVLQLFVDAVNYIDNALQATDPKIKDLATSGLGVLASGCRKERRNQRLLLDRSSDIIPLFRSELEYALYSHDVKNAPVEASGKAVLELLQACCELDQWCFKIAGKVDAVKTASGTKKEPLAPTIASLLSHSNINLAAIAADIMHTVSQHRNSFSALIGGNPELSLQAASILERECLPGTDSNQKIQKSARESACAILANMATTEQGRNLVLVDGKFAPESGPTKALASVLSNSKFLRIDSAACQLFAISALVNITVEPTGTAKLAVAESGAVPFLVDVLQGSLGNTKSHPPITIRRSAHLLSRVASLSPAKTLLQHPSVFKKLISILDSKNQDALKSRLEEHHASFIEGLVRIIAQLLDKGNKEILKMLEEKKTMNTFVAMLPPAKIEEVKTVVPGELNEDKAVKIGPGVTASSSTMKKFAPNLVGNVIKCIIQCVDDVDSVLAKQLCEAQGIERIIGVLASSDDGPVRKNCGVVLAKMARKV